MCMIETSESKSRDLITIIFEISLSYYLTYMRQKAKFIQEIGETAGFEHFWATPGYMIHLRDFWDVSDAINWARVRLYVS